MFIFEVQAILGSVNYE